MITSTSNTQIKNVINLIKKSGERKSRGLFVIEGIRMFRETPRNLIESIYVSESFAKNNPKELEGLQYETVSDRVFEHMSDTKTPQGILAIVRMKQCEIKDILGGAEPLLVVLENIQDPGNLGTIVRTSEGAQVSGILMTKDTVDIYNPKTIRSTMGALFRMPFMYFDSIDEIYELLAEHNIPTYAACLQGAVCYTDCDYRTKSAIVIGNEGNGLTKAAIEGAGMHIKIPMGGELESLNAAMSTGIIAYEAARQRRS